MTKWVYTFGGGEAEGSGGQRDLLGGKGANLAEMAHLGLPVPPGFTVTTEVCTWFYDHDRQYPDTLQGDVAAALAEVGRSTGRVFGDETQPLLVSVRSGARASMPGMMDTVLNLGLNDRTVVALAESAKDERFAYDSYRRFIQMYCNVVLDLPGHGFEEILEEFKEHRGYVLDTDLLVADWQGVIKRYKAKVLSETGKPFPQDPMVQLWGAIGAVFSSWMNNRAKTYRRLNAIPESWGTAVTVQAMVFGNMGDTSATGVAFTRNPSVGTHELYGEFLVNAQGEDVVAGIRTPQNITEAARIAACSDKPSLETVMPEVFRSFVETTQLLERHYRDMQDMEFTVERGTLWMLQTRNGKRTTKAALKIAIDMANEGLITREEAIRRIDPASLDQLLHPTLDPEAKRDLLATGLPASPGAAQGEIVFTSDEAEAAKIAGSKSILVRAETSPEDINGMHAAEGILTTRGGMTSHAAVVARGMGKPCVSGAGSIRVDAAKGTLSCAGVVLKKGDLITVDGSTGQVLRGLVPMLEPELSGDFSALMEWARRVPAHEGARQCRNAGRRQGGAALRRRRHRALPHRAHVLRGRPHRGGARDDPRRRRGGPARRPRQAAADAARGLQAAVPHHVGPARHDPPARPAAARIPAPHRRRDGRGGGLAGPVGRQGAAPRPGPARIQTRCWASAACASPSPIPRSPRCRRAPFSRARCWRAGIRARSSRPRSWCRW